MDEQKQDAYLRPHTALYKGDYYYYKTYKDRLVSVNLLITDVIIE